MFSQMEISEFCRIQRVTLFFFTRFLPQFCHGMHLTRNFKFLAPWDNSIPLYFTNCSTKLTLFKFFLFFLHFFFLLKAGLLAQGLIPRQFSERRHPYFLKFFRFVNSRKRGVDFFSSLCFLPFSRNHIET